MRPHRRFPAGALIPGLLLACGSDPQMPDAGETGIETPATGSEDGSSTASELDGSSSSSTGTPDVGDPDYPRPDPIDEAGDCPPGSFGPITFDMDGWVCLPECTGDPPECPSGGSGTAEGRCSTNPFSSASACTDDTDCDVDGERCGNVGNNQMGCLLPPSHCLLWCDDGQACPDGMTCSEAIGVCQYAP